MLVTSYDAFDQYHQQHAAPWERVALLRARPVFSWPATAADPIGALPPLLEEITYARPVDEAALRRELLRMRGRIERERAGDPRGGVHLRFSAGGLTDLEFLAAWGQLRAGAGDPGLRTSSPYRAIERLVARGEADRALPHDYRTLEQTLLRLRLLRDRTDDRLLPEERPALARSLETTDDALARDLDARRARIRAAFATTLGDPAAG